MVAKTLSTNQCPGEQYFPKLRREIDVSERAAETTPEAIYTWKPPWLTTGVENKEVQAFQTQDQVGMEGGAGGGEYT